MRASHSSLATDFEVSTPAIDALVTRVAALETRLPVVVVGDAATTALAGADTLVLKAQLLPPAAWQQDEDGAPVPTFSAARADVTD
jgi:hypothetical protein